MLRWSATGDMSAANTAAHLTDEPSFVAETLDWCNARRAEDGKPPLDRLPRGRPDDPTSCPCGKASGWLVYQDYATREGSEPFTLPESVTEFVIFFDDGELPQYDEALAPDALSGAHPGEVV